MAFRERPLSSWIHGAIARRNVIRGPQTVPLRPWERSPRRLRFGASPKQSSCWIPSASSNHGFTEVHAGEVQYSFANTRCPLPKLFTAIDRGLHGERG
jgi:hypothetical protein